MKKLLAIIAATLITFGCVNTPEQKEERVKPKWVQYYDMKFEQEGIAHIYDWEADDQMAFIWVDKHNNGPGCDHVAMLEIVNVDVIPPQWASIYIINSKTNMNPNMTPCETGYAIWTEYVKNKVMLKQEKKREDGI